MRRLRWSLLLLLGMLPSCFNAPVPLGDPATARFDTLLVGDWVAEGDPEESPVHDPPITRVYRFNEHEYLIDKADWTERANTRRIQRVWMRAFITDVAGVPFLNLRALTQPWARSANVDTDWTPVRYDLGGAGVLLRALEDDFSSKEFHRDTELYGELAARVNDAEIYFDSGVLYRRVPAATDTAAEEMSWARSWFEGVFLECSAPLAEPASARLDDALIGTWQPADENQPSTRFLPFNEHEYAVVEPDREGPYGIAARATPARAFTTVIAGVSFLSFASLGEKGYMFMKYRLDGDTLRARFLTPGSIAEATLREACRSPGGLRALLAPRVHDDGLYWGDFVLIRVPPPDEETQVLPVSAPIRVK